MQITIKLQQFDKNIVTCKSVSLMRQMDFYRHKIFTSINAKYSETILLRESIFYFYHCTLNIFVYWDFWLNKTKISEGVMFGVANL